MPVYDSPLEGGLSTLGGVYATGSGGKFFRSPGDLLHALRNGNINIADLGQVQFGSQGTGGTFTPQNDLMYGASGLPDPSGFQKGSAWFGSEADYNNFMSQFVNAGGARKKSWFRELFGDQAAGTQPIDRPPNTPADNPNYGQYFGGGTAMAPATNPYGQPSGGGTAAAGLTWSPDSLTPMPGRASRNNKVGNYW